MEVKLDMRRGMDISNVFNDLSNPPPLPLSPSPSSINSVTVAIRSALAKQEDLEVLRELCSGGIPPELRSDVWRAFLGVNRRPDAIGSWNGPLDCDNQSIIHQETLNQASKSNNVLEALTNTCTCT